ncbi:Tetratricopeptide repeat protein [Myxococcus hansupus]|uniref:Tetratricopeptide repeat protein n=1 Tax=Pseudomyxococcus hansupus TaxID=1297742 RepID=A0A0H4WQF0_9BACT|nr:CHAT domain-containing protein [Myxococcus hansupus]AKQ64989.1 Tetratricopeptide repeat protein [Myxococcus hansupus]
MMSPLCNRLSLFLDGELAPVDEENFRHHLARCDPCASGLHEAMQLELLGFNSMGDPVALEEDADEATAPWDWVPLPPPPPTAPEPSRLPSRSRGPWALLGAGGALATAVLLLLFFRLSARDAQDAVWLAKSPSRRIEARVAYARADGHRPFVPLRSGGVRGVSVSAVSPVVPLRALANLEDQGDLHGIAAAYLVRGDWRQASDFLQRLPPSPDRDSDLAIIALEQGHSETALALLEGVLRQAPDHAQAQWNRALVLREMGLTLLAADAFDAVAKQGAPGWSEEARIRARALRQQTQARGRAWKGARAAVRDLMVDAQARLPLDEAKQFPGIVRLAFYDAVRAAPSREWVVRLLPLADVLDGVQGGDVLRRYVLRVAAKDFSHRGPLARDYAKLVRGELASPGRLLETLRLSGEDDLYLGALINTVSAARHLEDFTRLSQAAEDPWLSLLAERELASEDERNGAWWKAEARLRAAVNACQGKGLSYRCATLKKRLSDLYLALNRPAEAFEQSWSGWRASREMEEWELEQQFLQELAHIARYRMDVASARAYLRESLSRMPDSCEQRTYVHRNLAYLAWSEFDTQGARDALELAQSCGRPLGLPGALLLSYLARFGADSQDADLLRRTLAELRRTEPSAGKLAQMGFAEGQFLLERDRATGLELLRSAISQAEALPDDVDARKTRMGAYNVLAHEAGRGGDSGEALSLMGAALRVDVPDRCVLGVAVDYERSVVALRDSQGALRGHFDAGRKAHLGKDADGLVPPALQSALRGCEQVDVLALPPVHGLRGLLPADLAWTYRVGRPQVLPPGGGSGEGPHLVINGVEAPSALGLPRLPPLAPPSMKDPRRVELSGMQATPSRVLAAMEQASEVEIHAHGAFSPEMSDASLVVLAPETDGRYALSAAQVRALKLAQSPLVLLATCSAARAMPFLHESFSLPVAFIEAGAATVLASTEEIPDSAGRFFEAVRERIRTGAPAALALRDERRTWLATQPGADWVHGILLFE